MPVLKVNGRTHDVQAAEDTPLLYALRNDLGLNGPKYGCGLAQCGTCTVLVDGKPSKLQQAFIDEQAMQCGYCVSGVIMRAQALLDQTPKPTEREVRLALDGNLCRCGAQNRMVRAVLRAAQEG